MWSPDSDGMPREVRQGGVPKSPGAQTLIPQIRKVSPTEGELGEYHFIWL